VEETPQVTRIFATIVVERPSQKAIIIGHQGQMLKTIGTQARQEMQKLVNGPVYLELFVKVEPKWRQTPYLLRDLGYRLES
jgi:GTP-binding protein Era